MSSYTALLSQGAAEVRAYAQSSPVAVNFPGAWLESIAIRMEKASALPSAEAQAIEINSIARILIDSGPLDNEFSPSFSAALSALQRSKKKANKTGRNATSA